MPRDIPVAEEAVRRLVEGEDHENSELRRLLTSGAIDALRLAGEAFGSRREIQQVIEAIDAAG